MARCHLCGVQATDPEKGPSRWARAVIDHEQVLVCPDCQAKSPEWIDQAAACPECGSKNLFRSLGDTVCRGCGHQWSEDEFAL